MDSYTKQINAWKTVWQKNKRPRFINGTVWEQLIANWEKEETGETSFRNSKNRKSDRGRKGMYVHNLGACSMSTKENELIEANDGNPIDRLQLFKVAHTNKTTGQIQNPVIKGVVDLVEAKIVSQSQPLSDDGDSTGASTNLSLLQINEMVEKVIDFIVYSLGRISGELCAGTLTEQGTFRDLITQGSCDLKDTIKVRLLDFFPFKNLLGK
uniref:Uncharacterized protein n=1 Tax=Brassica oleracea var. oleracea TaxID=109376 RepID=A0A0D2ZPJ9_BRAOL